MPDSDPTNCGIREGVIHLHSERCYRAGYEAGRAAGREAALAEVRDLVTAFSNFLRPAFTSLRAGRAAAGGARPVTDLLDTIDDAIAAWEAAPESWNPGDPLYEHPHDRGSVEMQHVRPMFELLDQYARHARCEPCQVSWTGTDPCWSCGVERPKDRRPGIAATLVVFDESHHFVLPSQIREFLERGPRAELTPARLDAALVGATDASHRMFEPAMRMHRVASVWFSGPVEPRPRRRAQDQPRPLPINGAAYHRRRRAPVARR